MNELRISNVESSVETESLQTTDHKNEMKTPESKYKTLFSIVSFIIFVIAVAEPFR